ncbi:MAG: hypothetical protein J6Y02_17980 [Pseudobutyrivibrio sp.]|nr:hypothetical protein [Pseudobutyrivibrio sp.]
MFNILKIAKRYYIVCDGCGCYRSYFDGTICLHGDKEKLYFFFDYMMTDDGSM